MEWRRTLQRRLGVAEDGVLGPVSYAALFRRVGADPWTAGRMAQTAPSVLASAGIDATPDRMVEFLGECAHETEGLCKFEEDLNYTSVKRLRQMFGSRVAGREASLLGNPEMLANVVYANRYGNGPESSGDGWRYRGRGALHTTFLSNYRAAEGYSGLPLVEKPDLAANPLYVLVVAAGFWTSRRLNERADAKDSRAVTAAINPAMAGLKDRAARKAAIRRLFQ